MRWEDGSGGGGPHGRLRCPAELTIYDMTKSLSHAHVISEVKIGGRSGHFVADP